MCEYCKGECLGCQEVNMKLLKETWQWIKEWNEWGMKDWIKAGVIAAIAIAVISGMAG